MGAVPKNNGIPFVLRKNGILVDKINKIKWRLSDLPQISGRTLEKANVLVQYPSYRNTLPSGTRITEYGFTEITEMACTTLMQCCCMMSLLLIMLLMNGILLMLSDIHTRILPSKHFACRVGHNPCGSGFVHIIILRNILFWPKNLWELGQWETMD